LYSACGECGYCLTGWETLCESQQNTGYSVNGGFAELALADARYVGKIPAGLEFADVAPHFCAGVTTYKAVKVSGAGPDKTVLISGVGGLGHMALQYARVTGARTIAVDVTEEKLELAKKLGADEVINPLEEDVVERIVALTDGVGADVIFDCAGLGDTLDQAFDATKRDGQVVLVAVPWEPLKVDPVNWMGREIDFRVSFASLPQDWRIALDLLASGRISASHLMSEASSIALEDIQAAFEGLMKPSSQLQVVIAL
jgi:propanol-preferring alcohol dehydrogenase